MPALHPGKATHLLELGATSLVALERDPTRATRISENLDLIGLPAQVIVGDATQPASWWDGAPIRRHPRRCALQCLWR
jgi:16S rRNA (cytosine967-C5)-methyltransferase